MGCFLLSFLWCDFLKKQIFPLFCSNHKTLSRLELNFKKKTYRSGRKVWKLGNITRVIFSDIPQFYPWDFRSSDIFRPIAREQWYHHKYIYIYIIFFLIFSIYLTSFLILVVFSPPSSPRSAPYLPSHPGAAQPVSASPESAKKYRNPATIPETFSTTVDSRGNNSELSSRSSSQSSLSLASTLSPHQTGGLNVGRLEPLIQTPSEGEDTGSELFSPST